MNSGQALDKVLFSIVNFGCITFIIMVKNINRVAFLQGKTESNNSHTNEEISKILNNVFLHFKNGFFDEAIDLLEQALKIDFEYKGVTSALKCAAFWSERKKKLEDIQDRYEKAEFLLSQWDFFTQFLNHI